MVLVSNKKKFIFIKPYLVNGRVIEKNLQKYCNSESDIVASMYNYVNNIHGNNENILKMSQKSKTWYCSVHLPQYILKSKINDFYKDNIFDQYLKISIIANPYILLIDFFWFYTLFIQKIYDDDGNIIKSSDKPNNINFYKNNQSINKWDNLKKMFNNWILSGILEKKQTSKWEYLNELFYYINEKTNNIDFYIRNEFINEDIEKLCNKLNIEKFVIEKQKKQPHKEYNNKKVSDYYDINTLEYIRKTFSFTIT